MAAVGDRPGPQVKAIRLDAHLVVGVVVLNLVAAAAVALVLRQSLAQERTTAAVTTQSLAKVLDEALTSAFDRIDLALLSIQDELDRQAASGRRDLVALDAVLARHRARAPDVLALRVLDRNGIPWRSAPPLIEPVSLADREYFGRLRDGAISVVSKPMPGRINPLPIVIFARRLTTPAGEFDGAVIGSITLERIGALLGGPNVGPHGAIALRTEDRVQVAWAGPQGTGGGLLLANTSATLKALLDAGATSATYDAHSGADGVLRTYSFLKLDHHPFYVFVGLAQDDYLAGWRQEVVFALAALAIFVVLSGLGAALARRAWRKQRAAEAALVAEKEWLAVTLRSIGDGVIATDLEQRVLFLNAVAERLTGWSAEAARGRPVGEVFRLVERRTRAPVASLLARALEAGDAINLPPGSLLLARDGSERVVADSGSPIRDEGGQAVGAVLVFRDVTAQEQAEGELARIQKVESLAVLAGGIAHDFNNLLAGIAGNVSLVREQVAPGSVAAEALADAEAASLRARGLTQQLLTFSRGGAPVKRTVDLSAVVAEAATFAAHGAGTAVRLEATPGLTVDADAGQVGQVVQNLVLNGIQAMGSSGTLAVRVGRDTLPADNQVGLPAGTYATFSVSDSGPGVPPEHLTSIFDPFFTTKAQGKGLGLSICHSIVRQHGGHIEVRSPPGEGATFRVYLPAAAAAAPASAATPVAAVPQAGAARRILVMDDEDVVRRLAARMLTPVGYEVVGARDGQEALERYAAARSAGRGFAAVVMDLTVPGGLGGLETIGKLLALDPEVRAIVSSGYSSDPVMANFAQHGFKGVLAKPYLAADLREAIARVLRDVPQ